MLTADLGALDRRIRIENWVPAAGFMSAGQGGWQEVITVFATVTDFLPSRAEQLADGIDMAARPARILTRWQPGITPAMRIVMGSLDAADDADPPPADRRVFQIVAGPAEIGRRVGLEMIATEYSTAGNPA
jgi:head-tail adaptor